TDPEEGLSLGLRGLVGDSKPLTRSGREHKCGEHIWNFNFNFILNASACTCV
uniref:Uncharacterized protein n=1 Tax=Oryzias sinensis TaxID=183150 RepID=A0A8C8A6Y2_9TELE